MPRAHALRPERAIRHGAEDLLGFLPLAEGLAAQIARTRATGLLAEVEGRVPGEGRTSFLNLLHGSLLALGLPVLRLDGRREPLALPGSGHLVRNAVHPVLLIDDIETDELVLHIIHDCPDHQLVTTRAPACADRSVNDAAARPAISFRLPAWSDVAIQDMGRFLSSAESADRVEPEPWCRLLGSAVSPREAWSLVNAVFAIEAAAGATRAEVLAAVAALRGVVPPNQTKTPDSPSRELTRLAALFCKRSDGLAAEGEVATPPAPQGGIRTLDRRADSERGTPDCLEAQRRVEATTTRIDAMVHAPDGATTRQFGVGSSPGELLNLLNDPSAVVRLRAATTLATLDEPLPASRLRPLLDDEVSDLRRIGALILGRLRDEESRALLEARLEDEHPSVRRAAAAALGRIGGADVFRPLLRVLRDKLPAVRMAAETALACIAATLPPQDLDEALEDPDLQVRQAAVRLAARLGHGGRLRLELVLQGEPGLATHAAVALGRLGDEGAIASLVAAAANGQSELRRAAVDAIEKLSDIGVVARLLQLAAEADDSRERQTAIRALSRSPCLIPQLLTELTEGSPTARRHAAEALGRSDDSRASVALRTLHQDGPSDLRCTAAAALLRLESGDRRTVKRSGDGAQSVRQPTGTAARPVRSLRSVKHPP